MFRVLSLAVVLSLATSAFALGAADSSLDPRSHNGEIAQGNANDPVTPGIEFFARDPPFPVVDFCANSGQKPTNDTQILEGSCSSTPLGTILNAEKFPSALFISPQNGQTIRGDQNNTIQIKFNNLKTGFFDDALNNYYGVPFTTDPTTGNLQGHSHVAVDDLGDGKTPPDANNKVFFKGLNEDGGGENILSVVVPADKLHTGIARFCSMIGGRGHAPPTLSLIQMGSIDDCVRVNVVGGTGAVADKAAQAAPVGMIIAPNGAMTNAPPPAANATTAAAPPANASAAPPANATAAPPAAAAAAAAVAAKAKPAAKNQARKPKGKRSLFMV